MLNAVPSVSRLYGIDDMMINEYGAVDGTRMGKKNINTRIKPTQFHFVYHKSHMI
jgi:hypothetical protein